MTTPSEDPAPHSCEHCADGAHADAPDPAAAARENLVGAGRRLTPRIMLGVLGLGLGLALAQRGGYSLPRAGIAYAAGAAAWLIAAWLGTLLGAVLTRRGARPQIALGQVLASGLAPLLALAIALTLQPVSDPGAGAQMLLTSGPVRLTTPLEALAPTGVAAAFGWFLASAIGELIGVRTLRARLEGQDEAGARARQEAEALTPAAIQRGEWLALALAAGFGAMVVVLAWVPWLAIVLAPLCAATTALLALRRLRGSNG